MKDRGTTDYDNGPLIHERLHQDRGLKLADNMTVRFYERTRTFPREELYSLTVNFARGVSVTANIVEGSSRESKRDYLHFLYIARGSLSETQYFIHRPAGLFSHEEEAADLHMHRSSLRVPSRVDQGGRERSRCCHEDRRCTQQHAGAMYRTCCRANVHMIEFRVCSQRSVVGGLP